MSKTSFALYWCLLNRTTAQKQNRSCSNVVISNSVIWFPLSSVFTLWLKRLETNVCAVSHNFLCCWLKVNLHPDLHGISLTVTWEQSHIMCKRTAWDKNPYLNSRESDGGGCVRADHQWHDGGAEAPEHVGQLQWKRHSMHDIYNNFQQKTKTNK